MNRLSITKTPKCYVGGAFIRSESGRTFPLHDANGAFVAHIPQCTRKDVRNAVEAAAKAGAGWARRTPYNRGQILYRLAEMLEARAGELEQALALGTRGARPTAAGRREVATTIDRIVHYAGWADKYEQVLGNVNPVSGPFSTSRSPSRWAWSASSPPTKPLCWRWSHCSCRSL
jgi:acyl-CoA reductase-like NAD-dependent aldehyde dehydrogenase